MPRALFILQSIFSLWMLVDAMRRRADYWWYPVIMFPGGELVYFFVVKVHDRELRWLKELFGFGRREKVSLERLRFELEQTPSFDNKLALAQALYDHELYVEAEGLFAEAVALDSSSKQALYGLGLSRISLGRPEEAIECLAQLVAQYPAYEDYAGWSNLAFALRRAGRETEAIERLEELVAISPRLNHRMLYAHYLADAGRRDEAEAQLRLGLEEHEHAPRFLKRKNRTWARQAKEMLRRLQTPA